MYTGIIQGIGIVLGIKRLNIQLILKIQPALKINDYQLGESIAVNGCCLTVIRFSELWFEAYISPETFSHTNLKNLKIRGQVNLERPLKLNDRLGGHIVNGHVDETATINQIQTSGISKIVTFAISKINSNFLIEKGSITLDGVSLTIAGYYKHFCQVVLIPETFSHTTAANWRVGYIVNVEIDVLAKSAKTIAKQDCISISKDFLSTHGYL